MEARAVDAEGHDWPGAPAASDGKLRGSSDVEANLPGRS